MKVKIYSRFNPPLVSGLTCVKPSMTSQEFKQECDINVLLKKYAVQAKLLGLPLSEVIPQPTSDNFGDFTNVDDFLHSMNKVAEMNNMFSNLPSDIRQQCDNDPANFLRMCQDESKFEELANRGIFDKEQVNEYFNVKKQVAEKSASGEKPVEKPVVKPVEKPVENSNT